MLAVLGFVVPEFIRVPGAQFSFEAIPQVRRDALNAVPPFVFLLGNSSVSGVGLKIMSLKCHSSGDRRSRRPDQ